MSFTETSKAANALDLECLDCPLAVRDSETDDAPQFHLGYSTASHVVADVTD